MVSHVTFSLLRIYASIEIACLTEVEEPVQRDLPYYRGRKYLSYDHRQFALMYDVEV